MFGEIVTTLMEASISQVIYDAGQQLAASTDSLTVTLNQTLNQLMGWPFRAATGFAKDSEGQKSDIFGSLIYTASQSQPTPDRESVRTD